MVKWSHKHLFRIVCCVGNIKREKYFVSAVIHKCQEFWFKNNSLIWLFTDFIFTKNKTMWTSQSKFTWVHWRGVSIYNIQRNMTFNIYETQAWRGVSILVLIYTWAIAVFKVGFVSHGYFIVIKSALHSDSSFIYRFFWVSAVFALQSKWEHFHFL